MATLALKSIQIGFLAVTNINDMQYENVFSSDAFHWYMEKKSPPYSSETKTHMPYK